MGKPDKECKKQLQAERFWSSVLLDRATSLKAQLASITTLAEELPVGTNIGLGSPTTEHSGEAQVPTILLFSYTSIHKLQRSLLHNNKLCIIGCLR